MAKVSALIVAAGRGARAGGTTPKQYVDLAGITVLARTARAFLGHPGVGSVTVVIHPDDDTLYRSAVSGLTREPLRARLTDAVPGGATRQGSVRLGLDALGVAGMGEQDIVLIHDAARPFVSEALISAVIDEVTRTGQGAVPAIAVSDTLKRVVAGDRHALLGETVAREGLVRVQTPQGFRFGSILEAHRKAYQLGRLDLTDDAAVAALSGLRVATVPGSEENHKLTTAEDMARAAAALTRETAGETRTGQGFDVHRFTAGDHVTLCGIRIAHTAALEGHSDADVGLHALTDALLGAIGEGDIGEHFPPSDPRWRGQASRLFVEDAAQRIARRGGRIINVDVTILCEAPRIGPHRAAMQAKVAEILKLGPGRVGVKATTTERLGFTGRREGIAAMAIATIVIPPTANR